MSNTSRSIHVRIQPPPPSGEGWGEGILALVALFLPAITLAAGTPRTFQEVSVVALAILGQATLALMAAAVAIYFGNTALNVLKMSKGEATQQRSALLWGIIIIFVMVTIWSIIEMLQNTLFDSAGGGGGTPAGADCAGFGDPNCTISI